jgi:N4-(beta-N-acetylglucosaminyl)-L-asparaginase
MAQRRDFLQTIGMMGLSLPVINKALTRPATYTPSGAGKALILCSRDEAWAKKVLPPAWQAFQASGNILDGIEAGGNVCELDPEDTSVGYGGFPDERGVVSLDASIMYGPTYKCGSVAALENIKKACSVARLVMERTDHAMIVGAGALAFAKAHGFPEENLLTENARLAWLEWKENLSENDDWLPPADKEYYNKARKKGTINVLGMGNNGEVAGLTTTSGLFGKIHGRVGDSPIIGAGLFVDNEVGAAGATGRGEELIRTCGSFLLVEKMRAGKSPQQACEEVIERIFYVNGGAKNVNFNVKMVAFNKDGEAGCASIMAEEKTLPYAAMITADGIKMVPGKVMKE